MESLSITDTEKAPVASIAPARPSNARARELMRRYGNPF